MIYLFPPGGLDFSNVVRKRMHDQGLHKIPSYVTAQLSTSFPEIHIPHFKELLWIPGPTYHFRSPMLSKEPRLVHGVFTRKGGISNLPYYSLNTSYSVGDRKENVKENLQRVRSTIGAEELIYMNQSHGAEVRVIHKESDRVPRQIPSTDATVTDKPYVALMVKQADCQGVILFDSNKAVVAVAHCGWRGNVQNILGRVVLKMTEAFHSKGEDLKVFIGPSLGPCCAEFVTHEKIFPPAFKQFMVRENYFDLWAISCSQLLEAGVREDNIELAGICTRCRTDLFFSYRAERTTGRFPTVAMLRK